MEIDDRLVSLITQELLKRLEGGNILVSPGGKEKVPLVLIGSVSCLSAATLASLEDRFHILTYNTLEEPDFPDTAPIVVTNLSIQALVRISAGDPGCTPEGQGLIWAILRGKTPFVLEEGIAWRRFSTTMPPALYEQYADHEKTIASYGIKIIKEAEMVSALLGKAEAPPSLPKKAPLVAPGVAIPGKSGGKRVITETELMRLCPMSKGKGQTLLIERGDILTPLALDYITAMQIGVCKS
jgi:ethanolamine utilization protein